MNVQRRWKYLGALVLGMVLLVAFLGYLHPNMLLDWETVMRLCGFR
jgi:hypothetical protein